MLQAWHACQHVASHIHQALEDLVSQSRGLAPLVAQLTVHHNSAGSWAYMMWQVQNDMSASTACSLGSAKVAQQSLQPSWSPIVHDNSSWLKGDAPSCTCAAWRQAVLLHVHHHLEATFGREQMQRWPKLCQEHIHFCNSLHLAPAAACYTVYEHCFATSVCCWQEKNGWPSCTWLSCAWALSKECSPIYNLFQLQWQRTAADMPLMW